MDMIQTIIQGGAVGIAAFTLFILWKLVSNHINSNTKALQELSQVIRDLKEFLVEHHK